MVIEANQGIVKLSQDMDYLHIYLHIQDIKGTKV